MPLIATAGTRVNPLERFGLIYGPTVVAVEAMLRKGDRPGVCLYFTDMRCSSYPETEPGFSVVWVNWSAPRRTGTANPGASALILPPAAAPTEALMSWVRGPASPRSLWDR